MGALLASGNRLDVLTRSSRPSNQHIRGRDDSEEKEMAALGEGRRSRVFQIHGTSSSEEGGPPCNRCLARWRLNILKTQKQRELSRLNKTIKQTTDNHPKCSKCQITFGDQHLATVGGWTEDGGVICSVCVLRP